MYTVEILATALPRPLTIALHVWFVVSDGQTKQRFEVIAPMFACGTNVVVVDYFLPYQGFRRSFFDDIFNPKKLSRVHSLYTIEGEKNSNAHALFSVITTSPNIYPARQKYRLWPGPNSNTYAAWVIGQVPELAVKLPWRAFGKNFRLS